MEVEEDVSPLGVGPVYERVDQQLANYNFVERRDILSEEAIGQFVRLSEIGNLLPNGF